MPYDKWARQGARPTSSTLWGKLARTRRATSNQSRPNNYSKCNLAGQQQPMSPGVQGPDRHVTPTAIARKIPPRAPGGWRTARNGQA